MSYRNSSFTPQLVGASSQAGAGVLNPWALPGLSGEIVQALAMSSIDPAIAVIALIACISLVTQGIADIAWPNGLTSPIGTSGLLIAPSGGGKSTVMRLLTEPIRRIIQELEREMLKPGRKALFFIEDATREAIVMHLVEWAVAGLFTDEGGLLKPLFKNAAPTLTKLTDGLPMHHARVSTGRASIENQRLTILAMMQPSVLEELRELLGARNGGQGMINRSIVGCARLAPTQAGVFNPSLPATTHARYSERLSDLIAKSIDAVRSKSKRATLQLEPMAAERFADIRRHARLKQGNARFASATEYVSRNPERVLRTAGALHVFHHGPVGEVQLESIEAAHHIDLWSIESYMALIEIPSKPTQLEEDVARLEHELTRAANVYGPTFKLSVLRRMSPNIGLTKSRFDRALPLLAHSGKISVYLNGREDWAFVNTSRMPFPLSPVSFPKTF